MLDYLVPMLLLLLCAVALRKQENAYELLLEGGKEGLKLLFSLIPTLVMLLTAVSMLRASGAIDTLGTLAKPVFSFLGIPPETAMLVLIRPISGSAALAVGADLMAAYGPDSEIGRTAAIMLGYFGAAGVRKTRYTIPAALTADLVGFCMASLTARLFFAG